VPPGISCDGNIATPDICEPNNNLCEASGLIQCISGAETNSCTPGVPALNDAICDGIDNNCNILIDEDFIETPTTCGVGACQRTGLMQCIAGTPINSCIPGTPLSTNDVTCNGIDDNCNGVVDEDCPLICQYASSASATSENTKGSLAIYAIGATNAPKVGICDKRPDWSGYGYSWTPEKWSVQGILTLTYDQPVKVTNLKIFGDFEMCWRNMWLKNSQTGEQKLIFNGNDYSCISERTLAGDFLADTVILQTCGTSWTATDAVELCGSLS